MTLGVCTLHSCRSIACSSEQPTCTGSLLQAQDHGSARHRLHPLAGLAAIAPLTSPASCAELSLTRWPPSSTQVRQEVTTFAAVAGPVARAALSARAAASRHRRPVMARSSMAVHERERQPSV